MCTLAFVSGNFQSPPLSPCTMYHTHLISSRPTLRLLMSDTLIPLLTAPPLWISHKISRVHSMHYCRRPLSAQRFLWTHPLTLALRLQHSPPPTRLPTHLSFPETTNHAVTYRRSLQCGEILKYIQCVSAFV